MGIGIRQLSKRVLKPMVIQSGIEFGYVTCNNEIIIPSKQKSTLVEGALPEIAAKKVGIVVVRIEPVRINAGYVGRQRECQEFRV
jgi:hypothetical protein